MTKGKNYRKICKEYYNYTDDEMKGKHVHHIDGNHTNNDPLNLKLVTPKEHAKLHNNFKSKTTYKLFSPNGETFIVSSNLKRWSYDRGLFPTNLVKVAKGVLNHCKGWRAIIINE